MITWCYFLPQTCRCFSECMNGESLTKWCSSTSDFNLFLFVPLSMFQSYNSKMIRSQNAIIDSINELFFVWMVLYVFCNRDMFQYPVAPETTYTTNNSSVGLSILAICFESRCTPRKSVYVLYYNIFWESHE